MFFNQMDHLEAEAEGEEKIEEHAHWAKDWGFPGKRHKTLKDNND